MARTEITRRLRAAGCVYADEEAALIADVGAVEGRRTTWEQMVARREAGEPLEQILGWAEFAGRRIAVEPGVFVPRRRSELLVTLAAGRLTAGQVAVDLCCGTGALGAALLARVPGLEVYATDVDPAAVRCARRNLPAHRVFEGDLYDSLPDVLSGRVQVLLANAPYVPSDEVAFLPAEARDHEHRAALDGGPDGLDVQRRVVADASRWLQVGGVVVIETGAAQATASAALMEAVGLAVTEHQDDVAGGCAVLGHLV